jgi:heat induced stress protein YflT/uncharacterized protein DUF2382
MATTTRTHNTVVGVFNDARMAQAAVEELRRVGFREDQIGVVTRGEQGETRATVTEGTGSHWEEGAAIGAAAGAGIGALWAVGMATIALPPILPAVMVSSWLVSILASAASGAAIAGIAGALIGLGIPEEEATFYEGEFKSGRTLITVQAPGRYEEARDILARFGAYDYANRRLQEDARGVNTAAVPVNREEVVVERRPATGQASTSEVLPGEEVRVPLAGEPNDVTARPPRKV